MNDKTRKREFFKKVLGDDDDDDDDDDNDDDDENEMILRNSWQTKGVMPYFQQESLSAILINANLGHAACSI